ncbi:MAG: recombinase family protein [Corynebacteriales bacterium]|nr:recombinase family protein [Mycobacteriales bacterium]
MKTDIKKGGASKRHRSAPIEVVVGYIRVSTEEQGDSGAGLAAQEASIRQDITRRGWQLLEIYTDVASGKSRAQRAGLDAAIDAVTTRRAGTLMVAKLDRLSRSLVDFATITGEAHKHGWNLVALDLGVDLSTPAGEFLANVMASAAQWERRIIGQRTSDALQAKKAAGVKLGRPSHVSPETLTFILEQRAKKISYAHIADFLNAQGVATAQGGTRWHASSVRSVERSRCSGS